jgi:CheY-like chemotaxis protein
MSEQMILVVEDSDSDVEAIERAIGRSHPAIHLEFVRRGTEVLPRLTDPAAALPDLILLDLNMPGENGLTILADIRAKPGLDDITIVVFTSSAEQIEAEACYAAGADSYIYKPINFALFQTVLCGAIDYWRSRWATPGGNVSQMVVPPAANDSAQA